MQVLTDDQLRLFEMLIYLAGGSNHLERALRQARGRGVPGTVISLEDILRQIFINSRSRGTLDDTLKRAEELSAVK